MKKHHIYHLIKISNFTNKLKLNVGSEVQIDEIEFHRRKNHKKGMKGVDKNFFIDGIGPETKFMPSSEYPQKRNVFKQAKA